MNKAILQLREGRSDNHILPFFWQHGEDEVTLRQYVKVIDEANCKSFCVESRPHPDFCGTKWWTDMDIILDEAKKRDMKVWILDDSHFPTGVANGAVRKAPLEKRRQSVCRVTVELTGEERDERIDLTGLIPGEYRFSGMMEQYILPMLLKDAPHYDDDRAIAVTAVSRESGDVIYAEMNGNEAVFHKPAGDVTVHVIGLSRNLGPHRDFINMLDPESCHILIDAVYEKHFEHYKQYFGNTIAGFFSDEPELGNGHLYFYDNLLGTDQDLPFSENLPAILEKKLGGEWANRLFLLWENGVDAEETSFVRHAYMDAITKLVRDSFSYQIGNWCRERGVMYIGHMIEDSNAHARTGSSLGHYFRGLQGQDMSGIDDIGGQVLPQGENEPSVGVMGARRDGEFYHYQLANLAASAASIEPGKAGRSMCEIFGNYGWKEGPRLEKYLADHFMVNGINYFVPHAFSAAPFPDPDCPPHFYAHGHNPQYRAFGCLMAYMNRVSTLISDGHRNSQVAVLYHGESEWAGRAMLSQKPLRQLMEAQIEADTIPSDVFAERELYKTIVGKTLKVNTQEYEVFILPEFEAITRAAAEGIIEMMKNDMPVLAINALPKRICDCEEPLEKERLIHELQSMKVVELEDLADEVRKHVTGNITIEPANSYVRAMHYTGKADIYYLVNEDSIPYEGTVTLKSQGVNLDQGYLYDAYLNKMYPIRLKNGQTKLTMLPLHSYIIVADQADADLLSQPMLVPESGKWTGEEKAQEMTNWTRSQCTGIQYPSFENAKEVSLPDTLAEEQPSFSGFVKYETELQGEEGKPSSLYIEDAYEAVEVFVNDESLGIQIVPPFAYDLTEHMKSGANTIRIEVATTLERYCYDLTKDDIRSAWRGVKEPVCGSGLTGKVWICRE